MLGQNDYATYMFNHAISLDPYDDITFRNWAWALHSHPSNDVAAASTKESIYNAIDTINWVRYLLHLGNRYELSLIIL